ncbi:MAG: sigma-70 family RNA polymerase sigma factor [Pseudomonadota bacterium]
MANPQNHEETDESLMVRIQQSDHQAFAVLVERHTNRFYAMAYRLLGHSGDAEDMVQDAFLKIWDNPSIWKSDRGAKFTTWFYRVVNNLCIDRMRKREKMTSSEIMDTYEDEGMLQDVSYQERQEQAYLEEAMQALPDKQRAALNLCFYEGLSNKDAADILGVKVKALESLLMRAKANLKDHLTRQGILQERESA